MRAVTWQGRRKYRSSTVPDPQIKEPTDAVIRVTSTNICGSDLHLYEVLGAFMSPGDIPGPRGHGVSSRRSAPRPVTFGSGTGWSSRSTSRADSASCATAVCQKPV